VDAFRYASHAEGWRRRRRRRRQRCKGDEVG